MNIPTESSQYIKYLLYHSMLFTTSEWDIIIKTLLFHFFDLKTYLYLFTSSVSVSSA